MATNAQDWWLRSAGANADYRVNKNYLFYGIYSDGSIGGGETNGGKYGGIHGDYSLPTNANHACAVVLGCYISESFRSQSWWLRSAFLGVRYGVDCFHDVESEKLSYAYSNNYTHAVVLGCYLFGFNIK